MFGWLALIFRDVSDERKQFHLLFQGDARLISFRLPVEPARLNRRESPDRCEAGGGYILFPCKSLELCFHIIATRLSAGGVADHMVTQMLRQNDAEVFKLYSQAKLGMMRETLGRLDRQANERGISYTERAS
jgi:hypothetical protein